MKQDDALWKALLEDVFDDFFLFFFEDYKDFVDLSRGFEFLDKELEQLFPAGDVYEDSPRFVDKLVKVFTKDEKEKWVLVHVEIQGYNDLEFSKRMFTYFSRILDKYNVPVTCIAIFTDSNRNFKPSEYRYNFMGVENTFKYNTYKVIEQEEDVLIKNDNPFAIIVLTVLLALKKGNLKDEEIRDLKVELVRALLKKAIPKIKIRALMNFIRYYVRLEKPENVAKFEREIDIITQKSPHLWGLKSFY